jgi:hypothetical protein
MIMILQVRYMRTWFTLADCFKVGVFLLKVCLLQERDPI